MNHLAQRNEPIDAAADDTATQTLARIRVDNLRLRIDETQPVHQNQHALIDEPEGNAPGAFYAVLSGSAELSVGEDTPIALRPTQAAFVFKHAHRLTPLHEPTRPARIITGTFRPTLNDHAIAASLLPDTLTASADDRSITPLLRLLEHELINPRRGSGPVAQRIVSTLLLRLLCDAVGSNEHTRTLLGASADPHLGPVLALMHARPQDRWTFERLAYEAGLSRTQFARCFHERLGCSPFEYLRQLRLARAEQLLRTTAMTIEEISIEVGYGSVSAFSAAFHKRARMAPGQYRELHRNSSAQG